MRKGFTLVELVTVILILGILAGVSVPKFMNVTQDATESSLLQTLARVRGAIQLYAAHNAGQLPGSDGSEAAFLSNLAPFIRGPFPENPARGLNTVDVQTSGAPLNFVSGAIGWRYDNITGQFIANSNKTSSDDTTKFWEL